MCEDTKNSCVADYNREGFISFIVNKLFVAKKKSFVGMETCHVQGTAFTSYIFLSVYRVFFLDAKLKSTYSCTPLILVLLKKNRSKKKIYS